MSVNMELVLPPVLFTVATWGLVRLAVAREREREQRSSSLHSSTCPPQSAHAKVA
jgi:hypothetical protein